MLWQIVFKVAGHTGFEFHPRWLMNTRAARVHEPCLAVAFHPGAPRGYRLKVADLEAMDYVVRTEDRPPERHSAERLRNGGLTGTPVRPQGP